MKWYVTMKEHGRMEGGRGREEGQACCKQNITSGPSSYTA